MHPSPLPDRLTAGPFTVRDGTEAGMTPMRLRAKDLDRSVWGVRVAGRADSIQARCALLAARLPATAFFSHATAAQLMGAPLPWSLEREQHLHVGTVAPARAPHARAIRGHQLALPSSDLVATGGLRHTSAARTWFDLAPMLSLPDLVAVGDYFVHWRLPFVSIAELEARAAGWAGRGARRLREALGLLSDRAESRPESHLRVILAVAGLPTPRVNHVLVDTEVGKRVRVDLIFERYLVAFEYQGDYHRTRSQWRKDMTRRSRLEAKGWYVMELNADDLEDPVELVSRIRSVLARRR